MSATSESSYYNVKVMLKTEMDNGTIKEKAELYLVKAVSVTDAEAKVHADFKDYRGDWYITSVVQTKIVDVIE